MQGRTSYPQLSLRGAVVGGRLTKSGCPLLFLVDGSARILHMGLKEWLTVSNPQFSVSPYASQLAMSGNTLGLTQHAVSLFSHALLEHSEAVSTKTIHSTIRYGSQLPCDLSNWPRHCTSVSSFLCQTLV